MLNNSAIVTREDVTLLASEFLGVSPDRLKVRLKEYRSVLDVYNRSFVLPDKVVAYLVSFGSFEATLFSNSIVSFSLFGQVRFFQGFYAGGTSGANTFNYPYCNLFFNSFITSSPRFSFSVSYLEFTVI